MAKKSGVIPGSSRGVAKHARPSKTDHARSGEAFPKPYSVKADYQGSPTKKSGTLNIR